MEFTISCPTHGKVNVSIEDVTSVVFHGFESIDVLFECPQCGAEISLSAKMPEMLITTLDLQEIAARVGSLDENVAELAELVAEELSGDGDLEVEYMMVPLSDESRERIDRYCEYFHRQLEGVDTVEGFLTEVDCG